MDYVSVRIKFSSWISDPKNKLVEDIIQLAMPQHL